MTRLPAQIPAGRERAFAQEYAMAAVAGQTNACPRWKELSLPALSCSPQAPRPRHGGAALARLPLQRQAQPRARSPPRQGRRLKRQGP